jgi:hypothetical protein
MAEVDFRGGAKLRIRAGPLNQSQHNHASRRRHAFHGDADVSDQRGALGDPLPDYTTTGRSRSAQSGV